MFPWIRFTSSRENVMLLNTMKMMMKHGDYDDGQFILYIPIAMMYK